ncbi:MAG: damage-inducible protein DinB [Proteobacteria bacterium]|nr:damage-inducible protein DinB [Pseudomonadota bacterium]
MSNAILVSLFEHKAWCNAGLAEALRALPADLDRKTRGLILGTFEHTHLVDRAFKARLEGVAPDLPAVVGDRMADLDSLIPAMAETDAWFVDYAGKVTADELARIVDFTYIIDGEPGRMTKADMLGHLITHGASHRGAIGRMLAELKLRGASDMMTTFRRPGA